MFNKCQETEQGSYQRLDNIWDNKSCIQPNHTIAGSIVQDIQCPNDTVQSDIKVSMGIKNRHTKKDKTQDTGLMLCRNRLTIKGDYRLGL